MTIITGMHRSGTSLVARMLFYAGANFGNPATFYPADEWNPGGYFEQREVLRLNLALLQGRLGKLSNILPPSTELIRKRSIPHSAALVEATQRFQSCTVKDPRFNYTGPIWEEHGTKIEKIIVCLRDPMEVALSLRKRNRLPIILGLHVWCDCLERLITNYQNRDMWVVDYSKLTSASTQLQEAAGVIRYLGLPFHEPKDADSIRTLIRVSEGLPPRTYSRRITSLWQHFAELSQKQLEPEFAQPRRIP